MGDRTMQRWMPPRLRHGMCGTPVYRCWVAMIGRCTNPRHPKYKTHGGRGITVCDRWRVFDNFYADMGAPPAGLTLERIENDRGYSKENCMWATRTQQNRNRRRLGNAEHYATWL